MMPSPERRPTSAARAGRGPARVCLCALLLAAALNMPRVGAKRHLAQASDAAPLPRPAPPPSGIMSGLFSQSAPTCTVQLNASSANGGASVKGSVRMHFPPDSPVEESHMIFFTEKPNRDAARLSNIYLAGNNFGQVFPDSPPNVALTGAIITEGGDITAVNMIFQADSAVAERPTSADTSSSYIEYAFTQAPAQQSASIFPPGDVTSATVIAGCGLLLDSGVVTDTSSPTGSPTASPTDSPTVACDEATMGTCENADVDCSAEYYQASAGVCKNCECSSKCYCDEDCHQFFDCCGDSCSVCGHGC